MDRVILQLKHGHQRSTLVGIKVLENYNIELKLRVFNDIKYTDDIHGKHMEYCDHDVNSLRSALLSWFNDERFVVTDESVHLQPGCEESFAKLLRFTTRQLVNFIGVYVEAEFNGYVESASFSNWTIYKCNPHEDEFYMEEEVDDAKAYIED